MNIKINAGTIVERGIGVGSLLRGSPLRRDRSELVYNTAIFK